MIWKQRVTRAFLIGCAFVAAPLWAADDDDSYSSDAPEVMQTTGDDSPNRISDHVIPLDPDRFPERPKPPIEWGDKLLGQGPINKGFELPTGAVWTPSLWAFGNMRSAVQTVDNGSGDQTEWVNRLDLFGNLRLSGTERLLVGLRPADEKGSFSGYRFESFGEDSDGEWVDGSNVEVTTLFFEGDLSEIFPMMNGGRQPHQIGITVGRQPLFIQEGMMINDNIDMVGISRNNIPMKGTSNFRTTFVAGWDEVGRNDNREDNSAVLVGWFNQADIYRQTVDVDFAYVSADESVLVDDPEAENFGDVQGTGSGYYVGLSNYMPMGIVNTSIRVNASWAADEETAAVSDGILIFGEFSWTPTGMGADNAYVNLYWGIDRYPSAARAPTVGGPLGRTGLLFASVGLGAYKPGLANKLTDNAGGAFGYQHFFREDRNLVVEFGLRHETESLQDRGVGLAASYQMVIAQHWVARADAFGSWTETSDLKVPEGGVDPVETFNDVEKYGARFELQFKF